MKRSLLQLIVYSIIPAVVIIIAKLGGIYLAGALFNIHIDLSGSVTSFLSFQNLVNAKEIVTISSYSDLFMYLGVAVGMSVILIQALYLHESHITPGTINKLAKYNLLSLVRGSFELYHSGIIWLIFMWLANIVVLINTTRALTDIWTLCICTIFSISYSIIFMKDLFAEIELTNNAKLN